MPLTKSVFRERVRELIGDPVRISGTATGGSLTTIVDTAKLTQEDGHWDGLWAFVITTTDNAAPKSEASKIETFSNASKQVTVDLPFSAAVGAGDTYGIAVFSHSRIDNAISRVLKEFSDYRPLKFSESLAVTANEKRFTPTSAGVIRYVNKIEKYTPGVEHTEYEFVWNKNTRQVEFENWFTEAKTLTLYAAKSHSLPSAEGDAMTYHDDDEDRLLRWCAARIMQSMVADEFRDNFGKLTPQSWTHGPVSETFGGTRDAVLKFCEKSVQEIIASFPSVKI